MFLEKNIHSSLFSSTALFIHRQNDNGWMGYCDKRTTTYGTRDSSSPICWVGRYEQTQKSKIVQHPQNTKQQSNNQSTKAVRRKNEELDTKKSLSLL